MTARTFALILIRIVAIKFLLETITAVSSQIPMLQSMRSDFEQDGSGYGHMLLWSMGILILGKALMSVLLLVYSGKLADRITGPNTEILEGHPELGAALTHVGILLIGISTLIYHLPRFLATSIQWFQAHAGTLPENMAKQQDGPMAQATLLFILSLFLLLRGKTLTRWLIRFSK